MKNRIKELRQKNNLTLKELGEKLGMANNTVSQYETGKREPKLATWQKLANFFKVSVPYIQGIEPDYTVSTDDTKKVINQALNNSYFDKTNTWYIEGTRKAVINFSEHDNLNLSKLDNSETNFLFWQNNFNFVFSYDAVIYYANRILDNNLKSKWHLYVSITTCINKHDRLLHQTQKGKIFSEKYKAKLEEQAHNFTYDLYFAKTDEDINKSFNRYIKFLRSQQSKLTSEKVSASVDAKNNIGKSALTNGNAIASSSHAFNGAGSINNKARKFASINKTFGKVSAIASSSRAFNGFASTGKRTSKLASINTGRWKVFPIDSMSAYMRNNHFLFAGGAKSAFHLGKIDNFASKGAVSHGNTELNSLLKHASKAKAINPSTKRSSNSAVIRSNHKNK